MGKAIGQLLSESSRRESDKIQFHSNCLLACMQGFRMLSDEGGSWGSICNTDRAEKHAVKLGIVHSHLGIMLLNMLTMAACVFSRAWHL